MEFLMNNWEIVTIVILVIDKIVALSPSKLDDLLWTSIKGIIYKITGKK
jgi:hypothetical protein